MFLQIPIQASDLRARRASRSFSFVLRCVFTRATRVALLFVCSSVQKKTNKNISASGVRKTGINPRTGKPYAPKRSGYKQVVVVWPDHLSKKRKGIYQVRIEKRGSLIIVRELENALF